jgi:hypothetical protein
MDAQVHKEPKAPLEVAVDEVSLLVLMHRPCMYVDLRHQVLQ